MRTFLFAAVIALATGGGADGQLPPQTVQQQIENQIGDFAQAKAEELADRAMRGALGTLHPDADLAFRRWDEAVRLWKKEKGAGAAPLLAEGVLFDCLGRLQGVKTSQLSGEHAHPVFADLAAERPARAARAFDAALKIDPSLIEARMRVARIRGMKNARALLELEGIARDQTDSPFAYLAAISRAAVAHAQGDRVSALHWYEQSLQLNPRSTAAAIALSALKPGTALSFATLDAHDLYYSYPCKVLTPGVAVLLEDRLRHVVLK
jgi:tetratricopeptide (TPR) repeat protein